MPANPLPIATPDTFTFCPGSNCSTVSTLPDLVLALVAELHQVRAGGAPAFFRWPSSALVSFRSGTSPKASCTAA